MSVQLGRHWCGFIHSCLCKSHSKSPNRVQERLFQIDAAPQSWRRTDLNTAIADSRVRLVMRFDLSNLWCEWGLNQLKI